MKEPRVLSKPANLIRDESASGMLPPPRSSSFTEVPEFGIESVLLDDVSWFGGWGAE